MTKILNFALKIKGGGTEGGTCEVLQPCHPPLNLERAPKHPFKSPYNIDFRNQHPNVVLKKLV